MDADQAALTFTALGQATRLELMRLLLGAGPGGVAAGELAVRLGVPASTLSFHLRALEQSGLIAATRQRRSLIYAPRIVQLRALIAFLVDACRDGGPERCGDIARRLTQNMEFLAMPAPARFNVLFLCTRNSARSIMAEAILAKLAPDRFASHSAGSEPSRDGPMPEVLSQLKALGHDISGLQAKSWDVFTGPDAPRMDFVIALSDMLDGEASPDFDARILTAAWPLPDPVQFHGSAAERAAMLNELYASLHRRIGIFTSLPFQALDRMAMKARLDELAHATQAVPAR
jgi:arsenate reductase